MHAGDPVPAEEEADDHREVMLDARRERDRLVAERAERQQHDDRHELARADRRRHERAQRSMPRSRRRAPRRATLRVVPPNSGSRGNGASLIVPGRRKWRKAVNGGQMWKPSGPLMQPKPSTSTRHAQRNAFWKAIPSVPPRAERHRAAEPGREAHEEHPSERRTARASRHGRHRRRSAGRCPGGHSLRSRRVRARKSPVGLSPSDRLLLARRVRPPKCPTVRAACANRLQRASTG